MSMPTYNGAIVIRTFNNLQTDYLTDFNDNTLKVLADHTHEGSGAGNPIHGTDAIQAGTITAASITDGTITTAKLAAATSVVVLDNAVYLQWRNNADSADLDVIKVNTSDNIEFEQDIDKFRVSNNITVKGQTAAAADHNLFKVNTSDEWEWLNSAHTQHVYPKTDSTYDLGSTSLRWNNIHTDALRFVNGGDDMDWYEEGSITPVLTFGGGSTGITYSIQTGLFTRIGRQVFFSIDLQLSSKGSSTGNASITGLPYTESTTTSHTVCVPFVTALTTTLGDVIAGAISGTSLGLYSSSTDGGGNSNVNETHFAATTRLILTGNYTV